MPTKPRTKKPAAKQRNAKMPRQSVSEIRRRIQDRYDADETGAVKAVAEAMAKALGRNLDDLLAVKQGTPVDAWQATEKDGCTVASYAASNDRAAPPPRTSPVEEAVARLLDAVCSSECLTDTTADRLKDIMSPSIPTTGTLLGGTEPGGSSELAARLNGIADRIYADGRRRLDILNRLEL